MFRAGHCPKHVETYYKWNIYLLAASSWCSYLSLYDARKHKTESYHFSLISAPDKVIRQLHALIVTPLPPRSQKKDPR